MKKKKRVRWVKRRIYWETTSQFTAIIPSGARELLVAVQPYGTSWLVLALEKSADARSVRAVFADHAHEEVGTYRTATRAFKSAEDYARKWKKRRRLEDCKCGVIR